MASNLSSIISSNTILIDGRLYYEYNREHIDGSYLFSIPTIMIKRLVLKPEIFITMFSEQYLITDVNLKIYYLIDETFSETLRASLENFYEGKIIFVLYTEYKEQNKEIIKLVSTVFDQFPPIVEAYEKISTPEMRCEMSEIIPGLFLGGEEAASDKTKLKEMDVTTILNITDHIPFHYESDFTYHRIPITDNLNINIRQYFERTCEIIDNIIENKQKILVHCYAGISRSATIVIAYIMKKNRMTMSEAYQFVEAKRKCISPNIGFCAQLMTFEEEIFI